ncbi:hypothetical protein Bca52824_042933 [Brassica carinata]|uniref:Uncharacterized protein n=1 Tax=Brassica carinata TaxID=52824 RepID=A0A8X7UZA2_BRACI|nr:hypothetical protein Bca52824_042933 [Brassica carinata]
MNTRPDESLLSSPGASKETRRITVDGEDEPETNRSTLKLEPRSQMWQIYESTKRLTAYNRSSNLRLTCMEVQTPL